MTDAVRVFGPALPYGRCRAVDSHFKGRTQFGLQAIGGDIGHGTRYIDRRQQLVWPGRTGNREAAAYYYGVCEAANAHTGGAVGDLPEWLREIGREVRGRQIRWIDRGQADLNGALSRYEVSAGR